MRSRMIAICMGILVTGHFSTLPQLFSIAWVLLLIFSLRVLLHYLYKTPDLFLSIGKFSTTLCWFFLLGVGWASGWGQHSLSRVLAANLEGRDIWVTGEVVSLPEPTGRARQFEFFVATACLELTGDSCSGSTVDVAGRRLLLNYYGEKLIAPGNRWLFQVRLNRPHGFANPGVFDYEAWLFEKRISAKGYVRENQSNTKLGENNLSLSALRYRLRNKILQASTGLNFQGIMLALTLGDKSLIRAQQWDLFNHTGTSHLIVISGLHVGFITLLVFNLTNYLVRLLPVLLLYIPAQTVAAYAAILGALFYSFLAGFSLPTQRAFIMIALFMWGKITARNTPVSMVFCIAATVVLMLSPLAGMSAGFWLSFIAVFALLFVFTGMNKIPDLGPGRRGTGYGEIDRGRYFSGWSDKWGRSQAVVFIALIVPLAMWTQQLSLVAPLANIVAIPLVSLVLVPVCLLAAMLLLVFDNAVVETLASWLFQLAEYLLQWLIGGLRLLLELAPSSGLFTFYSVSVWSCISAAIACLLLLMPRGWGGKYLFFPLLLPLLFPVTDQVATGQVEVDVLDVGQGLAVLVRTTHHTLVYDTGPRFSDSFDTGKAVVVPVLRRRGVASIDMLVVSHSDNDHAGGADSVLALMEVRAIRSGSSDFNPAMKSAAVSKRACVAGEKWSWDTVQFEFLHPDDNNSESANNSSCVLKIDVGGRSGREANPQYAPQSLLLVGDIEGRVERRLVDRYAGQLSADILVAPHHGSNTSSTSVFLDAVNPVVVIYSSGYRNQFGHPTIAVRERYRNRGTVAYNTANTGLLNFSLGGSGFSAQIHSFREENRRYWFTE